MHNLLHMMKRKNHHSLLNKNFHSLYSLHRLDHMKLRMLALMLVLLR